MKTKKRGKLKTQSLTKEERNDTNQIVTDFMLNNSERLLSMPYCQSKNTKTDAKNIANIQGALEY